MRLAFAHCLQLDESLLSQNPLWYDLQLYIVLDVRSRELRHERAGNPGRRFLLKAHDPQDVLIHPPPDYHSLGVVETLGAPTSADRVLYTLLLQFFAEIPELVESRFLPISPLGLGYIF